MPQPSAVSILVTAPRMLIARLVHGRLACLLVTCHGPHREPRTPQAAADYWAEVAGHLSAQRRALEPIILMADVNANLDDPSCADCWHAAAVNYFLRRFS